MLILVAGRDPLVVPVVTLSAKMLFNANSLAIKELGLSIGSHMGDFVDSLEISSVASRGSGFNTMPAPPPKGRSSVSRVCPLPIDEDQEFDLNHVAFNGTAKISLKQTPQPF